VRRHWNVASGENLEEEKPRGDLSLATVNSRNRSDKDSHTEQSLEGGAEEAGVSGQLLIGELRKPARRQGWSDELHPLCEREKPLKENPGRGSGMK
jgi:hypothetical protein